MNIRCMRRIGMAGLYSTFGIVLGSFFLLIIFAISGAHDPGVEIICEIFFPYNYICPDLLPDILTFYTFYLHWPLYGFFIGLAKNKKSLLCRWLFVFLVHFSAVFYCLLDKQS